MKYVIKKADFLKPLQRVQGIVEKRNTMPILSNVSLSASGGNLNILATDLEVFIKDTLETQVTEEGSVTVNARKLFEIVKELPDETIDVSSGKEGRVTIKGKKARFNIMGLPSKDFPVFPAVEETSLVEVNGDSLKEMIDKTSFAVSTDETRYNINGFLLEKDGQKTKMVSTDGHRLALIEKEADIGVTEKKSVLLPRKGVMEIRKLLDEEADGKFFMSILEKNVLMKKGSTLINIRLIEGEFPDYKKVVPAENNKEVVIERVDLLHSLKRMSILSSDRIKGVKFNFTKSTLTLSSSSPDIGDATEELDTEYGGEDLEIAFNARYIIDMLEAVDDEKVTILLKDSLNPGIITPGGSKGYSYVIMPMRL